MDARKTCSDCVYFDDIVSVRNGEQYGASRCRFNPPNSGQQQPMTNSANIACHEFVENRNE